VLAAALKNRWIPNCELAQRIRPLRWKLRVTATPNPSYIALKRSFPMIVLFAFLHHTAAFTLVAAVAIEFVLLRGELTLWAARRLQVTDAILGAAATVLLVVGLSRVFWFEKGPAYYLHSHAFLTKFSLFIIIALLSIVPTVEFLSWRKATKAGETPVVPAPKLRRVRMILHIELAAVVLILLCAAIMAKGGWV
jgi:putative membrane protein